MPANIGHLKAGGRQKGTPNKITADIRDRITAIIEDNYNQVAEDIAALSPEKRVETWIKLLDFVTPRMQRSEIKGEVSTGLYEAISKAFEGIDDAETH